MNITFLDFNEKKIFKFNATFHNYSCRISILHYCTGRRFFSTNLG